MPRDRTRWLDDLIDVVALLPWWAGLALAIASYGLLHWIFVPTPAAASAPLAASGTAGEAIVGGLTIFGQYLLPVVFVIAAAISAYGRSRRARTAQSRKIEPQWSRSGADRRHPHRRNEILPARHPERRKEDRRAQPSRSAVREDRWSVELLRRIEWKRLAYLCTAYFEELGFRAKTMLTGRDGNVVIYLYQGSARTPGIIVECRAGNASRVDVHPVREMQKAMTAKGVDEAIIVTNSAYTSEARQFAKDRKIHLVDAAGFLSLLSKLKPEQQRSLLELATQGDYATPTCPSCGAKMVLRVPAGSNKKFWICRSLPRCRSTLLAGVVKPRPG